MVSQLAMHMVPRIEGTVKNEKYCYRLAVVLDSELFEMRALTSTSMMRRKALATEGSVSLSTNSQKSSLKSRICT